jgi:hypothetical protein
MKKTHTSTSLSIHPIDGMELETTTRTLGECVTLEVGLRGSGVTWFLEFGTLDHVAEQLRQAAAALQAFELAERNRRRALEARRLRESLEVSA